MRRRDAVADDRFYLVQDLWVPSINCTTAVCLTKARFNDKVSGRTAYFPGKSFSINYVDGSGVAGGVYSDASEHLYCHI